MKIQPLILHDLAEVKNLQPLDWPDILPFIEFYIQTNYCFPIKCVQHHSIVGIGTTILHDHSAWLAHIIVHHDYRNQGIGTFLTQHLINSLTSPSIKTISLTATKLGEPVYTKAGFKNDGEYIFFKEGYTELSNAESIIPFEPPYAKSLLTLDLIVSGEYREQLLQPHFQHAYLAIDREGNLSGYFLPSLGEGLIVAQDAQTGTALMQLKYADGKRAVLPEQNVAGIDFLQRHGYKEFLRGSRMYLGKKLSWQPDKIYSRIGGNLG